jgi:hypothetical protein
MKGNPAMRSQLATSVAHFIGLGRTVKAAPVLKPQALAQAIAQVSPAADASSPAAAGEQQETAEVQASAETAEVQATAEQPVTQPVTSLTPELQARLDALAAAAKPDDDDENPDDEEKDDDEEELKGKGKRASARRRERARCRAIMNSPAAAANPAAAVHLALNTGIPRKMALSLLAALPAAGASSGLDAAMAAEGRPNLGPGATTKPDGHQIAASWDGAFRKARASGSRAANDTAAGWDKAFAAQR